MKKLLIQAIKFVGLSGIGWILDFCIVILLGFVSANHSINNFISSWVGVTFVFIFALIDNAIKSINDREIIFFMILLI